MWYQIKGDALFLQLKVKPNSKKTCIDSKRHDQLKISIKSSPIAGKANQELVSFLSKIFKIPKKFVIIVHGENTKEKFIKLPFNESIREILEHIVDDKED